MATSRNHLFHRPEECDSFQPCFFEHQTDEEFYATRASMPSEEIWDKFELLPTPPRSPNREPITDLPCSLLDNEAERLHLQPLLLEATLADLAEDLHVPALPKPHSFPETPPTFTGTSGLNSKLIQDCMWSGRSLHQTGDVCVETKKQDKIGVTGGSGFCVSRKSCGSDSVSGDINLSTECVDPAAVFPYPINVSREYLDIDTPSDSGNEEEDDEEIDVVNVEKIPVSHLPTRRKPILVSRVTAERVVKKSELQAASLLLPAVHACHTYSKQIPPGRDYTSCRSGTSSPVHGHSSNLKRTSGSISMPSSPQAMRPTSSKRMKRHLTTPAELKRVAQKLSKACSSSGRSYKTEYSSSSSSCSSRLGSDSEGECGGKRTQHNVLERKRRNDLKYSFFKLRDTVPELAQQERAPKVVILKKAANHIHELTSKHKQMLSELDRQRLRNEQLKQTLLLLQC